MLNKSSDFNVQEYWLEIANQLGYHHADVWYDEELNGYIQTPDGCIEFGPYSDVPDALSQEAYSKLYKLVERYQGLEYELLLATAQYEGASDVDAIAEAYEESYRDHLYDI